MAKTVMSIKVDKDIKEKAQKIAKSIGIPLGTLINAYLRQLVKNKTVSFSTEKTVTMSKKLEIQLEKIENDIKENKNISKAFNSVENMINELKADDT